VAHKRDEEDLKQMPWILRVEHRSLYRYEGDVAASFNEVRMLPSSGQDQFVLERTLQVRPRATVFPYTDYWRTLTHVVEVHEPHSQLEIVARSRVQTGTQVANGESNTSWSTLDDLELQDLYAETLAPTPRTDLADVPILSRLADALRNTPTPRDAVHGTIAAVRERLRYQPGATQIDTSAQDALALGEGVCQDFAHLTIGLLRMVGIPARYVSGYAFPTEETIVGTPIPAESHAWVEAWLGAWTPFDPTSGGFRRERYVAIGRGRDYGDVPPITGIYLGPPAADLQVEVTITREP
jgi:transglutaminase-like putative cysteine protease